MAYCKNKPVSDSTRVEYDSFFSQRQSALGQKLNIEDLLIAPVQRLPRYQLLIRDLLKDTKKAKLDTTKIEVTVQRMSMCYFQIWFLFVFLNNLFSSLSLVLHSLFVSRLFLCYCYEVRDEGIDGYYNHGMYIIQLNIYLSMQKDWDHNACACPSIKGYLLRD